MCFLLSLTVSKVAVLKTSPTIIYVFTFSLKEGTGKEGPSNPKKARVARAPHGDSLPES